MATKFQRQKTRDDALSSLSAAIDTLNLAEEISSFAPAKAVFSSVTVLLNVIRNAMANEQSYKELGLNDADICRAIDQAQPKSQTQAQPQPPPQPQTQPQTQQGTKEKGQEDLSQSVCEAINQLTTTVAGIQKKVTKQSGRSQASRLAHAKSEKEQIAAWKMELNRILHVFNTELGLNEPTPGGEPSGS